MIQDAAPVARNGSDVLITLIQTLGPILATVITYLLTRKRSVAIEAKAEVAAAETVRGNEAIAEVHKVVNGRTDALMAENKRLVATVAALEAEKANRRSTDP